MTESSYWGQLTAIDLYDCPKELLTNKLHLKKFPKELCKQIKMKPHGETLVDQFGEGDLFGLSAIQFIETSTIVVHLDDVGSRAEPSQAERQSSTAGRSLRYPPRAGHTA